MLQEKRPASPHRPPLLRRLLVDYGRPDSLSYRLRARRAETVRTLILAAQTFAPDHRLRILDVGGVPNYWRIIGLDWLRLTGTRVELLNLHRIAVPPDARDVLQSSVGDGCNLHRFADSSVDLVHSNSVIEHVGSDERMALFASEARRVGRAYYVQTPNFWFPIEPHYIAPAVHWLPVGWRAAMVLHGLIAVDRKARDREDALSIVGLNRLLTQRRMRALFPDAEHRVERLFGLAKSLIAIRTPADR